MAPAAFARLLEAVENASFSSRRRAVIDTAARRHWFEAAQLERVIDALGFASDRTHATRVLGPRLVDPENAFSILEAYPFSSEREAAAKLFRRL
jgi:hypothetical protein